MYGCEWDDEDDTTDGYNQFGYDGEDFIALDLKNLRWIAPTPQAFITKLRWDQNRAELELLEELHQQGVCCLAEEAPGLWEEHSAENR